MARVVGDYMFERQIGSGSFSVVWLARHRIRGTEVAVKEIVMERLSKKLRESLLSEVVILKKISHPNIIALHDIIEASGRIYLILEYCRGGDLSMYIQRHGRVPEATAKYFMQQLATGLQVLRENNLIHRDLKPQNLLLSSYNDNSVLKIADFGFARSLQPRGLAETLCGSPLYMAPEIMQLQKYDAKADLWSVGAILFQLVTGKTPFTGINQIQLLQNIIKSNVLRFPSDNSLSSDCIDLCQKLLRRNPVERLTFEEFFNHPFLAEHQPDELLSRTSSDMREVFPLAESSPSRPSMESSQEDCLPFILDDESSGQDGSSSALKSKGAIRSTYGFSVNNKADKSPVSSPSKNVGILSRFSSSLKKPETTSYGRDSHRLLSRKVKETTATQKDSAMADSLEFIDQDYVLVPGPPLDMSSSSVSALGPCNSPGKLDGSPIALRKNSSLSAPVPITGRAIRNVHDIGSLENRSSPASGTSQGSMDTIEQPSTHCMTRIRSLQQCASVMAELVREEVDNGRRLEAFSIQLVILAMWKQALHICHTQAASARDGCPSHEVGTREDTKQGPSGYSNTDSPLADAICSQIEKDFLAEVGNAEELAKEMGQIDETAEMPDAIEMIFQSALTLGRHGAVDEMMGNAERAASRYSKSVCLLHFLLVEASSLVLNPPVSLTNSDRYRLRSYIDIISNRHGQSRSQRMALLKCEDR